MARSISAPTLTLSLVLGLTALARGQELTVLDAATARLIKQEVSGDAAFEHVRFATQFHRPRGGSDGLWRVAEYHAEKATEYGLSDVSLIRQRAETRPWNPRFADLWLVDPPERLASTLQSAVHLADFSRSTDVTAELVDVGAGDAADLEGKDLAGKIVLTFGGLGAVMREAVCARGAAGVLWYPSPFGGDNGIDGGGYARPDQIRWQSIAPEDDEECAPTFAFVLSLRQGLALRRRIAAAEQPLAVRALVQADFGSAQGEEPWQVMVEAKIRGSDPDVRQDVVFTGHLQEEATSANDDASGTASTLEVARALNTLIESGRLPRPRRDLRFWWVTEISSERRYFADHPEVVERLWVAVNQDMVGAEQTQDLMRAQKATRVPATRFHLLNDVMEAVVEHMVATNRFELAQLQNGIPLYPDAHVAHRGTWHRFNADVIFFHNSTDHMTFTEAPIGIPGITFTNMPDRFIHSSDDDLWNIDPTQLGRNAAAVALIGYTLASAGPSDVPRLAAEVVGRGAERLGRNLRIALALIGPESGPADWRAAREQIDFAAERERSALASFAQIGADERTVAALLEGLDRRAGAAHDELERRRAALALPPAPTPELSEAERALAALRPTVVGGPADFLARRGSISGVTGLHDLMAFEVLNAIDGQRDGLSICRFVAAEAREAGAHYFGTVTPEGVLEYLGNAIESGLVR